MANKALNQVSQVQSTELANVKTFLAVMNNGEIKQMSKEDMASVVGELLNINNSWFRRRNPIDFTDMNNITDAGAYRVWGNMDLTDEERMGIVMNEGFVLEVFDTGTECVQRLIALNSYINIYQRVTISRDRKEWRPWTKFTVIQV